MPKLTALHPISHDGKDYQEGDTFSVKDAAQVAQLVDSGAAVVEGSKTKAQAQAEDEAAAAAAAAEAAAQAQALAAAEAEAAAAEAGQSSQG